MFLSLDLLLSGFVFLQETAACTLKHVQTLIIHYNSTHTCYLEKLHKTTTTKKPPQIKSGTG